MRGDVGEGRRAGAAVRSVVAGAVVLVGGAAVVATGCISYEDDSLARETRQRLVVADEPIGALSIAEARHEVTEHGANEIVLTGRVGGVDDPFVVDQGGFFITPVPGAPVANVHTHDDEHEHAAATTPAGEAEHDHEHDEGSHDHAPAAGKSGHDEADHDHAHEAGQPDHDHEGHDHAAADHDHAAHDPAHVHDPSDPKHAENCPFCKRNRDGDKDVVLVQLTDGAGQVMAGDPRQLLGLAEDQVVTIEGHPSMDGPNLYVKMDKIFIHK